MKLNFWQMLGVVLLIIGAVWMFMRDDEKKRPNRGNPAPQNATTQPAR